MFLCLQRVAREMIPRRSGVIVNIASISGKGYAGTSDAIYAASKGAVISLTRIAALALCLASAGARNITGQSFNVDGGVIFD